MFLAYTYDERQKVYKETFLLNFIFPLLQKLLGHIIE